MVSAGCFSRVPLNMLCSVKVPAIKHASITNLLLFHRFVDQNENYRAIAKTDPLQAAYSMEDKGDEIAIDNDPESVDAFGLGFAPMTDSDLMIGLVAKERLMKLLDHPMLKNHLLKERNLLALLVRCASRGRLSD